MKAKPECKAERLSLDVISTLPQTILETILCLLPTNQAARTSILSREWRYKWTKIPKLEFHDCIQHEESEIKNMGKRCTYFYEILKVLLQHQGLIHELTMDTCDDCNRFDFDLITLYLSKHHSVKKLKLDDPCDDSSCFKLPISVFSLQHLTYLHLSCVDVEHQSILNGFANLKSLVLSSVRISTKTLVRLLTKCPSLKSLDMYLGSSHVYDRHCTVIELFECLPVIEHLKINGYEFEWLVPGLVPQELPTLLFHLKYFCFEEACFTDGIGLDLLLVLIKCSPNLEKIRIEMDQQEYEAEYPNVWEVCANVWLENLNELEIECLTNEEPEMEFVKFILARSPKLKKVSIRVSFVDRSKNMEMLKDLLHAPCVSPVIITFK